MAKSRFPSYLAQALSGVTQTRAGKEMGLGQPTLSMLLSGEKKPNYEHIVKLAVYLNVHPADIFEIAGRPKDAEVCRRLMPKECIAGPLAERFRRLLRLGMARDLDGAMRRLEAPWEANRMSFQLLVKDMGCRAACLTAWHMSECEVLYRWKCTEKQAARLAEKGKASGWKGFPYEGSGMKLELFLSGGNMNQSHIRSGLESWASSFKSVLMR